MGFGEVVPNGSLPVFSVDTEEEAQHLIVMVCPRDRAGNHYARELAQEQTLSNLEKFSDKLQMAHDLFKKKGRCKCS